MHDFFLSIYQPKKCLAYQFLACCLICPHTTQILISQSFLFTLHTFLSAFSITLLKDLTVPFTWEWYVVPFWWFTWNSSISASIVWFKKCEPWPLINIVRHPNLDRIYSKMNFTMVSMLQSFISLTTTSKSYSLNDNNHRHSFPPKIGLFTKYFSVEW